MLVVAQLRNAARISGFSHVGFNAPHGVSVPKPYQAYDGRAEGPTRKHRWKGPRRATAEEAAQDYCDYMDNGRTSPVVNLESAGHKRRRYSPGTRTGRVSLTQDGYVYCIGEQGRALAVKVGYAQDAEFRIGDLQTGNPRKLVILGVLRGTKADEHDLHAKYIDYNVLGEWFRPTPELLSEFDIDPESVIA